MHTRPPRPGLNGAPVKSIDHIPMRTPGHAGNGGQGPRYTIDDVTLVVARPPPTTHMYATTT